MSIEIKKPIIIIGTGRSGSTVFFDTFARHRNTAWINALSVRRTSIPALSRLAVDSTHWPILGDWLRNVISPIEGYELWERLATGFRRPYRDLYHTDVTNRKKAQIHKTLSKFLSPARHRLLLKLTGWPRLTYLYDVFPDAYFIHILRDGRAVTNSFLHVNFWNGWSGPENWRLGPLSSEDEAIWNAHDQSFVALAALYWKILMRAYRSASEKIPQEQYLEIRYESLCDSPLETYRRVLEYCNLEWTSDFQQAIESTAFVYQNDRWLHDLTEQQQAIISDVLKEDLEFYGYT